MNFAVSYSGGKDSALALYRMITQGHRPVAMITTVDYTQDRSWFHGIQSELLNKVSESLNIPMIICACKPEEYTESFEDALKKSKNLGAEACVFGDIDIEVHSEWNNARCDAAGLKCILPLWQEEREALVKEFIDCGFKAVIKIVQLKALDESFLGKILTYELIEQIKSTGSDPCGENGEYHTFVYDGPIFSSPVSFSVKGTVDFVTHRAVDIICLQ
jgi:uncharacterized protein (TIGR00290 family)